MELNVRMTGSNAYGIHNKALWLTITTWPIQPTTILYETLWFAVRSGKKSLILTHTLCIVFTGRDDPIQPEHLKCFYECWKDNEAVCKDMEAVLSSRTNIEISDTVIKVIYWWAPCTWGSLQFLQSYGIESLILSCLCSVFVLKCWEIHKF